VNEPPFPDSICHRCAAHRYVEGRATVFVLCTALPDKYPRQPRAVVPDAGDDEGRAK
jgi:hypothetical protein